MIQRSSRTTSLLGSSLNSSQLSLYSHASSVRSGAELARVSSGGGQASKTVSGHGYLTSSRTVSAARGAQSKSQKGAISRARERRKQDRRRAHTAAADDEESLDGGDTDAKNGDLESYLMSFGEEKAGRQMGPKANSIRKRKSGAQNKSVLPRGSELDWDKLLASGDVELMSEVHSEDDDVFSDNIEDPGGGLNGSDFLKRPSMRMDSPGPLDEVEQTKGEKLRRISNVSSVKFLGENSSSPTVSDLVLTDSLDSLSSTTHTTPMATGQPRQPHINTRNQLSNSDQSLERNALNDAQKAADLISTNGIDVGAVRSQDRAKAVTMRARSATPSDSHATILSEEQSISESFDFKPGIHVLSSIDRLEADIDQLHHHQSEESSFEQHLYDVHSLRELEEHWEDPPPRPRYSDKDKTRLSTSHDKSENNSTNKSSVSTKQAQFPTELKPRLSSFKFSAASTIAEDIQHKVGVNYSSDEFESESVSEVESIVTETNDSVKEDPDSVITHSGDGRELAETVASGDSDDDDDDDDDDRREERHSDGDMEHSELSYSSFSEAEQVDKSELTESQQQSTLTPGSSSHPPSTSNKKHSKPSKTSTSTAAGACRDACVQTESLANVPSSSKPALTGYPSVTVGHHYGKEYLDPSPILPHVVSPDALEVVTGYSPSVVALTDMLRTQLSITRSLVAQTRQLTATVSSSITPTYHYTTLEETKQYIASNRPKLLSLEEARKLVQLEHQ